MYVKYRWQIKIFSGTNETAFNVGIFSEVSYWLLRNKQPIEIEAQISQSTKGTAPK